MWTSSSPSLLPSWPPSQEKLNLAYPLWECFISYSDWENGEKSLGTTFISSMGRKLTGTPTCLEFLAFAHQKKDANRSTPKSSTCSSIVRGWPNCPKLFNFAPRFQAPSPGLVDSPFIPANFRGGGVADCFLRCRDVPALRRREVVLRENPGNVRSRRSVLPGKPLPSDSRGRARG